MERMLSFDIARKLTGPDPRAKGLVLKRITGDRARTVMLVSTGGKTGNDRMRAACDDYRLRTASDISYAVRGKSVEVSIAENENAVLTMMDFAKTLPFIQEDVRECLTFVCRYRRALCFGAPFEVFYADCDEGAFRISVGIICREEVSDEQVFSSVMAVLDSCSMGIVRTDL